jgi:ferrous iron transport protein B
MLSAHACAVPALMSTRVIEDRRDRLVAILVLPLLTCSARLPVYAMITALLFTGRPVLGGLVIAGAYALGITAALAAAWTFKRTLLPGARRPLVLELPTYKVPHLRNALLAMRDRGGLFLRKAGGMILLISVAMWMLSTYPELPDERLAEIAPASAVTDIQALLAKAAAHHAAGAAEPAREAAARAAAIAARYRLEYALAGRIGKWIEPIFAPLGFDWRIDIGVISSFAARETLVSTLAIVYGVGAEGADDPSRLRDTLRGQVRADGTPAFGMATAFSLLVFFALAMQCLPTQAVTRRETGSWRYAVLQFAYMTALAYTAAFVTYQVLSRLGLG